MNRFQALLLRLSRFSGLLIVLIILFFAVTITIFTYLFMRNVDYAFDGAYGAGAFTRGGRAGHVYHVTALEDSYKPGTLRHALTQKGARTIVFDVAGIIDLKSPLIVKNGFVTVAGQTAPGDGICIKGDSVIFQCNHVILRYLRFRFGTKDKKASLIIKNQNNIIIDHCSLSWGNPSNLDFFDNSDSTIQWCIIGESLGAYGARVGGYDISIHHNYFVNNSIGNPYFWQERLNLLDDVLIDFRNNVLYNWGSQSVHGVHLGLYNLVKNYYKFGSSTIIPARFQIVDTGAKNTVPGRVFVANNFVFLNPLNTNDNIMGVYPNTIYLVESKNSMISTREFPHELIYSHSVHRAKDKVLKYAGASLKRDIIDTNMVETVNVKEMEHTSFRNDPSIYPKYTNQGMSTASDTDGDGIPDYWEIDNGLNPKNVYDGRKLSIKEKKYTNLEVYLNSLVEPITKAEYRGHNINFSSYLLFMRKMVNKFRDN